MNGTRSDRPLRLGDVLRAALDRLPVARELADHALWVHWEAVVGATLAIFIAMNWGFSATLLAASCAYLFALGCFVAATK